MENWHKDEILEELHHHREELAERFDFSLERLYEYYSSVPIGPEIPRVAIQPAPVKRSEK